MAKLTLLVDFDGVLASYTGWKGPDVLGEPLQYARHAMLNLSRHFTLVCFTTRPEEPVRRWLTSHGFPHMRVTNHKDPAFLQIDDRCIRFDGAWTDELLHAIKTFKPWWQKPTDETCAGVPESHPASAPSDLPDVPIDTHTE